MYPALSNWTGFSEAQASVLTVTVSSQVLNQFLGHRYRRPVKSLFSPVSVPACSTSATLPLQQPAIQTACCPPSTKRPQELGALGAGGRLQECLQWRVKEQATGAQDGSIEAPARAHWTCCCPHAQRALPDKQLHRLHLASHIWMKTECSARKRARGLAQGNVAAT
jgi:hypothetical protein